MATNQESQVYITDAKERREQDEINAEKGMSTKVTSTVSTEEAEDDRETRPAKHINWSDAMIDTLIAILPLYFVAFCVAAYIRDGTLANSFRNQAILQMAKFNPTIFPIIFTLIFAKFIKAVANAKLERGASVGSIQHLLGSRTLVSSVFTPMRLRTWSIVVPLLVVMWACNPLGGQLSLRSVSRATNVTVIDTPFVYVDPMQEIDLRALPADSDPSYNRVIDTSFNTALLTPASSKNGTQDVFGNIQIPMLEYLRLNQTADVDGWFYTLGRNLTGLEAIVADTIDLPQHRKLIYASLIGIPYIANLTISSLTETNASSSDDLSAKLQRIKQDLFGEQVMNTRLEFTLQSSYVYSDCSFQPLHVGSPLPSGDEGIYVSNNVSMNTFGNATDFVTNGAGLTIKYDGNHTMNSTSVRNIVFESFLAVNDVDLGMTENGGSTGTTYPTISEARCGLSTTHVEAQVSCATSSNCTVSKIRESKAPHQPNYLTFLDGATIPASIDAGDDFTIPYRQKLARELMSNFVNATGPPSGIFNLSPLESFFTYPDSPWKAAISGMGASSGQSNQLPINLVGDLLFSQRLTQLLNTYWLTSAEPFQMVTGIDLEMVESGESTVPLPTTMGTTFVEKIVLRCHIPYMAVLLVISIALFGMGMATAYLDATRKGPDVLDDFVNSLRHNPYVHVDDKLGSSMEDGKEMVQRLKHTVVKIGDVHPGESVGYVAIGTPNHVQPVEHLDHRRHYA
ncbi:hypothetical protein AC579_5302 [Pseudocercospora musae]|uniref:Uncharacterized protein n=1 Tax=Pseudocercospora musae TaxID=113226 RepID=A0A139I336_9PEZI|nr:hypothetical protein AC579_5302 [Pseudocercospora musae]KXT09100.1 hypothetical protein AC579_5302 [Pseudocercospora musae]